MLTTPVAMRSSVCVQLAAGAGALGMPGVVGALAAYATPQVADNMKNDSTSGLLSMQVLELGVDQCTWSDRISSQTVPNKAKLSITAAEPMSLAIPAKGWRSVPDRSTTASTALFNISTTRINSIGLTSKARSTPVRPRYSPAGITTTDSSTSWRNADSSRQVCMKP